MLGALALCGLVMALVLLSDPRVMTQIDRAVTLVKSRTTSAPVAFSAGTAPARIAPAIAAAVQITPVKSAPVQSAPVQATPATPPVMTPVMTPVRTGPAPSTRATRVRVRRAGILSDK